MTTEEKARAYDEALKKAKNKLHYPDKPCFVDVTEIFPELKDSEDERIRKELISLVKNYGPQNANPELYQNMLAWLEKQGGQNPAWSEEDEKMFNSAIWHIKNSCGNGGKNSGEFEVYNWLKSIKNRVQPKQGEQQPDDISIKEKAHQIAWEMSKHYDPNACKQEWCEMAAIDMASWLERQCETK